MDTTTTDTLLAMHMEIKVITVALDMLDMLVTELLDKLVTPLTPQLHSSPQHQLEVMDMVALVMEQLAMEELATERLAMDTELAMPVMEVMPLTVTEEAAMVEIIPMEMARPMVEIMDMPMDMDTAIMEQVRFDDTVLTKSIASP